MKLAKYRVQLSTEKKYLSKYEYKYKYEYSIPVMSTVRLTRFRKLQKSFDLSIIQGCYYNCTLIASLSQDIFGIFNSYSALQPLAYTTLDNHYQIWWLEATIATV